MDNPIYFNQFLNGHLPDAYRYFGAHHVVIDGQDGYFFRCYAPMAKQISVIGDFNRWDGSQNIMQKVDYRGLFECFIPGAKEFQKYKLHIFGCDNFIKDKQDPFAFCNEVRGETCSILLDIDQIHVDDAEFVSKRDRNFDRPVSIYEFHMGTFKRRADGSCYNYSELTNIKKKN